MKLFRDNVGKIEGEPLWLEILTEGQEHAVVCGCKPEQGYCILQLNVHDDPMMMGSLGMERETVVALVKALQDVLEEYP